MTRLRAGIVGLGVGEAHIRGYESHPDCSVVGLCDIAPEKEELARAKYPDKRFYRDAAELIADPAKLRFLGIDPKQSPATLRRRVEDLVNPALRRLADALSL